MSHHRFTFTMDQTPVAAVDLLQQRKAQRIFNAYQFGGYLISRDIPVFVDGRAELYGEKFVMDFFKAIEVKKLDNLTRLLEEYKIDATLMVADAPGRAGARPHQGLEAALCRRHRRDPCAG